MLRTLTAALALVSPARAGFYEAPAYTLVHDHDTFEVRDYAPALEARVRIERGYDGAWSPGFRVLADYIFGGTQSGESISMTVPVAATPAAPGEDAWTIAFTMPSEYTLDSLPQPTNPRVEVVQTEPQRWAVRRFSGRASGPRADAELEALRVAMGAAGLEASGPPVFAQFNPPWIPSWFRHNEVMLPL